MKKKLAACVQIFPVKSIYRWKGKIEKTKEFLILFKVNSRKKNSLINVIKRMHTYELPEIILINMNPCSNEYWEWLSENIG